MITLLDRSIKCIHIDVYDFPVFHFLHSKIKFFLYVRELAGILTGREGTTVTLDTDNGPVAFEVNAASSVQLCDDEDLFD